MFEDRSDAGDRLATVLAERGVVADVVVAIPRGGVPVGRAVADRLDAPLEVVVASKMGAPNNPEFAIGAVAEDGSVWRNDDAIRELGVSEEYVASERERERASAAEKARTYRDGDRPDFGGERVVVVDDGVATGATMRACLSLVRGDDPERVVVAVPVGPADTLDELATMADDVIAVEEPAVFRSVGAYYRTFDQVSDDEARSYLR